jgi:hypothetical protein
MLTIVPVVRSEHLPELFGELILLPCGVRVVLASLMISNAKSHSAAIAKLKGFDRVRRILCNFLVQYSYGTIQITCHVILRWVEDSLAQQIVIFELDSLGIQVRGAAHRGADAKTKIGRPGKSISKRIIAPCGIHVNL